MTMQSSERAIRTRRGSRGRRSGPPDRATSPSSCAGAATGAPRFYYWSACSDDHSLNTSLETVGGGRMFEGFELSTIDTGETTIRVRRGGSGPPLLLLHGNPETHVMWHLVAPRLAQDFTVVATDLRGYGDSGKPENTPDHEPYSNARWLATRWP